MPKFAKLAASAASALALLAAAQSASAFTFSNVGDNFTVNWSSIIDGATLSSSVKYTLDSKTDADTWVFKIDAANNSSGTGNNRLVSFGIEVVNPDLSSTSDNSGTWDTSINVNFPSFHQVDFCAFAGPNCSGGAGGGLGEGGSTSFKVTMNFASTIASGVTFNYDFPAKYQAVGKAGKSYELAGCVQGDTSCGPRPPQEIPEPGTLALLGLSLLGAGAAARRRFF